MKYFKKYIPDKISTLPRLDRELSIRFFQNALDKNGKCDTGFLQDLLTEAGLHTVSYYQRCDYCPAIAMGLSEGCQPPPVLMPRLQNWMEKNKMEELLGII